MDYDQQPNQQDTFYGQPYPVVPPKPPVKGKSFAIAAFVLAMVAYVSLITAITIWFELSIVELWAESVSYNVIIFDEPVLRLAIKLSAGFAILPAFVSDILVIFAYVGHGQNVKSGRVSKLVLAFSIIATIIATLSLVAAVFFLF